MVMYNGHIVYYFILNVKYFLHQIARLAIIVPMSLEMMGGSLTSPNFAPRWNSMAKQREAVFHPHFIEDLRYWVQTDRKLALRTLVLVEEILRDPFQGTGKPEPLKYLAPNTWSRRLTQEHRIVYLVTEERVVFLQGRYHYSS